MHPIAKEALTDVNKIRVVCGVKPLRNIRKGKQGSDSLCPVVRSLSECGCVLVTHRNMTFAGTASPEIKHVLIVNQPLVCHYHYSPTLALKKFVRMFDAGDLPEYEYRAEYENRLYR